MRKLTTDPVLGWIFILLIGWSAPALATVYVPSDPTTGEYNTTDGTWDPVTRTFTLSANVSDRISITEDKVILDGAGYSAFGVDIQNRIDTTVTRMVAQSQGSTYPIINIRYSTRTTLIDNDISSVDYVFAAVDFRYNSGVSIIDNTITTPGNGIYSSSSRGGDTVIDNNNIAVGYSTSIRLNSTSSESITIINNTITPTGYKPRAITVSYAGALNLAGNVILIDEHIDQSHGMILNYNNGVNINDNVISSYYGMSVNYSNNASVFDNTISCELHAISLWYSDDAAVFDNEITGTTGYGWGISVYNSNNSSVTSNSVSNKDRGVLFNYSAGNEMVGNTIYENSYGVYADTATDTTIYHNNFINNDIQAYVGFNVGVAFNLDVPVGGNYWSDWTSPDADGDNIVDNPYEVLFAGLDLFPWTKANGWNDLDNDGVSDDLDNCPTVFNPDQTDVNNDGFGDACVSVNTEISDDVDLGTGVIIGDGVSVGSGAEIGDEVTIGQDSDIGTGSSVGDDTVIEEDVIIESDTSIGSNVQIGEGVKIGDNVTIGNDVVIGEYATIGDDVIIGNNVTIGIGVKIKKGTVIPDFSVVTDDM